MGREDDFAIRRQELAGLSDAELKEKFWGLTNQVVEPLLKLAKTHTTPSIERAVLLRMGFSSLETQPIVAKCLENELLGKGAGHIVWRLAEIKGISVREAGLALGQGLYWQEVKNFFAGGQAK